MKLRLMKAIDKIGKRVLADPLPVVLILMSLAIYLPGINWGIPTPTGNDFTHAWGNDDQVPLPALAEMHNTFVIAKPDRNVAPPWFHEFLLACAYSPYLIYLLLTGGLKQPSPVFPFGFADPISAFRHLAWIGRSVSILLAMAVILGAYHAGKYLWNRKAGFLAAIFTMLMFPMAYYARLGDLDVPVLGWTGLGLAIVAVSLRQGLTIKRGVWLGIFVALGIGTKDQAFASFILLAPVLLWLHLKQGRAEKLWRWNSVWVAPLASMATFVTAYILANGIPIDPRRYAQHIGKVFAATSTTAYYTRYPATAAGFAAQARDICGYLVDVMSWPVLICAVVGVLLCLQRDRLSLIMLLASVGCFVFLLPVRFSRVHYLLPIALPLNLFAGYAVARGLEAGWHLRWIAIILAVAAPGYLLVQTIDLTHDMIHDSRYAATSWLEAQTRPGDSVLYSAAGMGVPLVQKNVEMIKVVKRQEALPTIAQRRPDFIIIQPRDFNQDRLRVEWRRGPHSIYPDYIPPEVFAGLNDETLGYRLVAQFQTPRLLPWLNRPFLSYPTVNPPILIFARSDRAAGMQKLEPWKEPPYYPRFSRVRELSIDSEEEDRKRSN